MSQELGYQSYQDQPSVTPRLIVAGIGLLLMGLCGVCMLAFVPFALSAGTSAGAMTNPTMRLSLIFSSILVVVATIIVIWTGIACFLGKRWVRPILLIFSTLGLALAIPTLAMLGVAMLHPQNTPMPPWAGIIGLSVIGLIYLGVPLAYLLMFRPLHVKELLSQLDRKSRWTDSIPIPLLGMSLVTLLLAVQLPWGVVAIPRPILFSVQMPRWIALIPMLGFMVLQVIAAVWLFRKQIAGWWLAVGVVMILSASNLVNVLVLGKHFYEQAFGPELAAQMAQSPFNSVNGQIVTHVLWIAIMLAGAIWVKQMCLFRDSGPRGFAVVEQQPQ